MLPKNLSSQRISQYKVRKARGGIVPEVIDAATNTEICVDLPGESVPTNLLEELSRRAAVEIGRVHLLG